jgi:hypothetical protein
LKKKNHILTNTPAAPRASALKTSVPRRTPPSRKTGIFPSAAFTIYSRQATEPLIKSMKELGVEYDIDNIALPHITKRLTN